MQICGISCTQGLLGVFYFNGRSWLSSWDEIFSQTISDYMVTTIVPNVKGIKIYLKFRIGSCWNTMSYLKKEMSQQLNFSIVYSYLAEHSRDQKILMCVFVMTNIFI